MKKNRVLKSFIILFIPALIFSRQRTYGHVSDINPPYIPWFTGSLLPPSAVNAKPGHPVIAPYFTLPLSYGEYDEHWHLHKTENTWGLNPFIEYLFGLNNFIGIDLYTSMITNFKNGKSSTHLEDSDVVIGFQLSQDDHHSWRPDIRLGYQQTLPTGNYQKLDPEKKGIDSTGQGSFQRGASLVVQKLFLVKKQFLLIKWASSYMNAGSVHVEGYNTYGGGQGTYGKVRPGSTTSFFTSMEYSINQRWVFAFDFLYQQQSKSTFHGENGHTKNGIENKVGLPRMTQISIAPEIEYNLTETSGFLFGLWGTIAGRNAAAFSSFVFAYYQAF
ncbi:MAG: hypothetical protein WDZ28_02230 [Simkaniaceae bacterium]